MTDNSSVGLCWRGLSLNRGRHYGKLVYCVIKQSRKTFSSVNCEMDKYCCVYYLFNQIFMETFYSSFSYNASRIGRYLLLLRRCRFYCGAFYNSEGHFKMNMALPTGDNFQRSSTVNYYGNDWEITKDGNRHYDLQYRGYPNASIDKIDSQSMEGWSTNGCYHDSVNSIPLGTQYFHIFFFDAL